MVLGLATIRGLPSELVGIPFDEASLDPSGGLFVILRLVDSDFMGFVAEPLNYLI
ncbi:Guanylate cyclase [Caligus rogercresseyi]|uniref:Guanylate cyclase n=1 Tax=Caligus rogercresseyi TaxID=217165 RepID=A0A7T8KF18_CALRO|nr:Guanylate cyclase [Caligus rogercresseyi]